MGIGLEIFLAFVGICITLLLAVNFIVDKYLRGDFTKEPADDGRCYDSDENEESPLGKTAPYKSYKEDNALELIKETGFRRTFASNATVTVDLQYLKHSCCIVGNIRTLDNLDYLDKDSPDDIYFQLKLVPNTKFLAKTNVKTARNKVLALSFTMGPISLDVLANNQLCIRLYGKKPKRFSRWKVYGECYVPILELLWQEDSLEIKRDILPKAQKRINLNPVRTFLSHGDLENTTEFVDNQETGSGVVKRSESFCISEG